MRAMGAATSATEPRTVGFRPTTAESGATQHCGARALRPDLQQSCSPAVGAGRMKQRPCPQTTSVKAAVYAVQKSRRSGKRRLIY